MAEGLAALLALDRSCGILNHFRAGQTDEVVCVYAHTLICNGKWEMLFFFLMCEKTERQAYCPCPYCLLVIVSLVY